VTNVLLVEGDEIQRIMERSLFLCYGCVQHRRMGTAHSSMGALGSLGSLNDRVTEMVGALALGVCLDMTARRPSPQKVSIATGKPKRDPRAAGAPTDYDFVNKKDILIGNPGEEEVDCTEVVRNYVAGKDEPKGSSNQRMHRGHYQMQVYGPGLKLRRLQFHRPYWQGSPDAPIAVRPHKRRDDA
jgi:hypothetical protein